MLSREMQKTVNFTGIAVFPVPSWLCAADAGSTPAFATLSKTFRPSSEMLPNTV